MHDLTLDSCILLNRRKDFVQCISIGKSHFICQGMAELNKDVLHSGTHYYQGVQYFIIQVQLNRHLDISS